MSADVPPLTLTQEIAKARVMHSFLPDDDERTKNEFAADEVAESEWLRAVRAEAWDAGFDAGHYVSPAESRDCECRNNPYRAEVS